ncbi:voltage-gated hydrogen channel 1-like isoform X2 [Antedon mediterranea]|uniref:voltage-gated hydrogen channel 1-like isoform X2 n=1 Tax=Antedon mediterranea TaxID=105859 RepID=UPI003AF86101
MESNSNETEESLPETSKKNHGGKDEMGFFKPKQEDEEGIVKNEDTEIGAAPTHHITFTAGEDTFRGKLQRILHSHNFHVVIIALVLADCILVICELVLDLSAVENENKACEGEGDGDEEEHTAEKELTAALVLHYMSICILSIFLVEIMFKLYAFQLEFFKHKLEMFDAVIVIISFVLDIVFLIYEETFMAVIQLLIFLRLWRIVRIVNGLVLSVEAKAHEKITAQKFLREEAEIELYELRKHYEEQQKQMEMIVAEAQKQGIVLNSITKKDSMKNEKQVVEVDLNGPPSYSELHEGNDGINLSTTSSKVTYEMQDEECKKE